MMDHTVIVWSLDSIDPVQLLEGSDRRLAALGPGLALVPVNGERHDPPLPVDTRTGSPKARERPEVPQVIPGAWRLAMDRLEPPTHRVHGAPTTIA